MNKKIENAIFYLLFIIGLGVFIYYIYIAIQAPCGKLGYTLCAAIGEDFFHLYQAGYNFVHGYYVYDSEAGQHLATPFFMQTRYFPATFILFGWPFLFFDEPFIAYHAYLYLSIFIHFCGLWAIWAIYKKFKSNKVILGLSFMLWLSFYPLNSEWRMGQFNDIAGVFFLFTTALLIYRKELLGGISWIISLTWKPFALFSLPYFIKTRDKKALTLFSFFFVISTGIYISYFQLKNPNALKEFLDIILFVKNREGFQIHYIDNFGVFSLLGEIFYNSSVVLYTWSCRIFIVLLFALYGFVSLIANTKKELPRIYFLLFSTATLLIYHKEVWESVLCFWLPIIIVLLIIARNVKEKVFIFVCALFLATPSLFYFQQIYETDFWRFLLISEKAIPQLVLYSYLAIKCISLSRGDKKIVQSAIE